VSAVDERTLHVPVSREQLTVLVLPASVLQAVTSAPGVELKTSDRHVVVSPVDRPIDLVVTTTQYVYVLMLEPEAKGADTVVIEDARLGGEAGGGRTGREAAMAFEDTVLDLLRAAASGRWPKGSAPRVLPAAEAPTWTDLAAEQIVSADARVGGGLYEVRRYVLRNDAARPRSFREQEFYTGQEFGIALSRQVVEPGERVVVSVVLPGRERAPEADPLDRLDPDPARGATRGSR
jgi:hypothetical protein